MHSRTEIMIEEQAPALVETQPALQLPVRPRKKWLLRAGVAAAIAIGVGAFFLYRSSPAPPAVNTQWEQLTFFTDSAVYPALSSDGRMLAFIRGSNSFFGAGDIYVELLPGGEPVQLTHDSMSKLAPSFRRITRRSHIASFNLGTHWRCLFSVASPICCCPTPHP
jgi:hypothetical protein